MGLGCIFIMHWTAMTLLWQGHYGICLSAAAVYIITDVTAWTSGFLLGVKWHVSDVMQSQTALSVLDCVG